MQEKLSLAERDRRYKLVRQAMKERGLDVLLVWGYGSKWEWLMANVHYLSGGIGGNGEEGLLVFPLEGDPTFIIWGGLHLADGWIDYGVWTRDFRGKKGGSFVVPAVERLKELKLTKPTIGIPGMLEKEKIQFPLSMFTRLREELPKADLRDASGLIEDIRLVKSPEEWALMKKAQLMGDATMDAIAKVIRPGVPENEVVAVAYHTMLSHGADTPLQFIWRVGMARGRLQYTRGRPLQKGDIISTEFSPMVHGYVAHFNTGFVVGDWPDKESEKVYQAALASYRGGYNAIRPGIPAVELAQAFMKPLAGTSFKPRGLFFHGSGLGTEDPTFGRVTYDSSGKWQLIPEQTSFVVREGVTLGFEPGARLGIHSSYEPEPGARSLEDSMEIFIGDSVQVTRDGARRLGKKEPAWVICK